MSVSKVTPIGRASFPHLDKPNTFNKYALCLLLPKSDPKVKEFVTWLRDAVSREALNIAGAQGVQTAMTHFCSFKDGDNTAAFTSPRTEYAGCWVLNLTRAAALGKPCIVDRNRQPIDPSSIYAGCNVIAYIDVFGYKYGPKKSVSIGFQHVMKVSDNAPFSGSGIDVDNAFANLDIPEVSDDAGSFGVPEQPTQPTVQTPRSFSTPVDPFMGV